MAAAHYDCVFIFEMRDGRIARETAWRWARAHACGAPGAGGTARDSQ
jgi:hypothetical protein